MADRLPPELLECQSWITWRAEWTTKADGTPKMGKVPCDPSHGYNASFDDNHTNYATVLQRVASLRKRMGTHFGIGIAFSGVKGFFCLDGDDDLVGGPSDRLRWVAENYPTWGERSISGKGVHLFYLGDANAKENWLWKNSKIEVFGTTGFIAVTGDCLDPAPPPMIDGTQLLTTIRADGTRLEKKESPKRESKPFIPRADGSELPGEDFEGKVSWQEVLEPHGWTLADGDWDAGKLTRPGKNGGCSATVGVCRGSKQEPLLHVFTNNAEPFSEGQTIGKFNAYKLLNHRDDTKAAAAALASKGYGSKPPTILMNGKPIGNASTHSHTSTGTQAEPVGWQWDLIDSPALIDGDFRPTWAVKRLIVALQPLIIGGPEKTLKTNTSIDLAVSLSSQTPFLGHFDVYRKIRVAILSGESGAHTIQETFRRVCKAKDIDPRECDIHWGFSLPSLANVHDLDNLERGIRENGIGFIVVDPAYLAMLKGIDPNNAKNFFAMGELLSAFSTRCISSGCTPCIVHHANKRLLPGETMELHHLSYSGFSQFARQWLLYSRLSEYQGDGKHEIQLNAGGSCGQGGRFAISIDEGVLNEDFTGRTWDVHVEGVGEHRDNARQAREADKQAEKGRKEKEKEDAKIKKTREDLERDCETIYQALKAADLTARQIREARGWSGTRLNRVAEELLSRGMIEPTTVKRPKGKGETEVAAYRVIDPNRDTGTYRDKPGQEVSFETPVPERFIPGQLLSLS